MCTSLNSKWIIYIPLRKLFPSPEIIRMTYQIFNLINIVYLFKPEELILNIYYIVIICLDVFLI